MAAPVCPLSAGDPPVTESRILVHYSVSADPAPIERKFGLKFLKPIRGTLVRVYLVTSPEGVAAVLEKLNREPGVELAEVDHVMEKQ